MKALFLVLASSFAIPAFASCFTCEGILEEDGRTVSAQGCYSTRRGVSTMKGVLDIYRYGDYGSDHRYFGAEDVTVHETGDSALIQANFNDSSATIRTYFQSGKTTMTLFLPKRRNSNGKVVPKIDHTFTNAACTFH